MRIPRKAIMVLERWYIRERGKMKGPYGLEQLRSLHENGGIGRFAQLSSDRKTWISSTEIDRVLYGPSDVEKGPPSLRFSSDPSVNQLFLIPFPVGVLLFMHFVTAGLFSFVWIVTLHGRLHRFQQSDLSAGRALGFSFVPFFNFYWYFIVFMSLCDRLNAIRSRVNLASNVPKVLAIIVSTLVAVPAATALIGWFLMYQFESRGMDPNEPFRMFVLYPLILLAIDFAIVFPLFCAIVQSSFNQIGFVQIDQFESST